jgi:hypothetical protein
MKKRQSRYIRPDRKKLGRIEIHERDIQILKLVYDYRFIRTDHITALIEGDRTSIEKRLRKLWEHGHIARHFLLVSPGREPSTRRAIYSIYYRGATILAKDGIDSQLLKTAIKRNKSDLKYMEHQLVISNFRAVLTLALRQQESGTKVRFWRQDNGLRDRVDMLIGREKKSIAIAPDSFFAIEESTLKNMYWFFEADRYTMDQNKFLRRMKAYWQYFNDKKYQKKYDIQNIRVLTVCPNSTIRDKRLERTKEIKKYKKGSKEVLTGSRLFWFVSEEDYNLREPEEILREIFHVARKDEEKGHSLLE